MFFSAQYRLRDKEDFSRVFRQADTRQHQRYLMLLGADNPKSHARLGLAIKKQHVKRAVERNLIKRIIRESFRGKITTLPPKDMVVLSKPGIAGLNPKAIRTMSDDIFNQIKRRRS